MNQQLAVLNQMARNAAARITPDDSGPDDGERRRESRSPSLKASLQGMTIELHGTPEDSLADVRAEYCALLNDIQSIGEDLEEQVDADSSDGEGDSTNTMESLPDGMQSSSPLDLGGSGFY